MSPDLICQTYHHKYPFINATHHDPNVLIWIDFMGYYLTINDIKVEIIVDISIFFIQLNYHCLYLYCYHLQWQKLDVSTIYPLLLAILTTQPLLLTVSTVYPSRLAVCFNNLSISFNLLFITFSCFSFLSITFGFDFFACLLASLHALLVTGCPGVLSDLVCRYIFYTFLSITSFFP